MWTDNLYAKVRLTVILDVNSAAEDLVRIQCHEAELYSKYKQYYGYVFI